MGAEGASGELSVVVSWKTSECVEKSCAGEWHVGCSAPRAGREARSRVWLSRRPSAWSRRRRARMRPSVLRAPGVYRRGCGLKSLLRPLGARPGVARHKAEKRNGGFL